MTGSPRTVLLHGWGSSAVRTWNGTRLLQRLEAGGRRPLLVDLPGHGRPGGSTDPAAYTDIVKMVGRSLPDEALDGVGFSLGGKVLLWLAAAHPRQFRRLVIGGVGDNIFRPEQGQPLAAGLRALDGTDLGSLSPFITEARASAGDPEALAAVILRPSNPPEPAALRTVRSEVLLIRGENDAIAPTVAVLVDALPRVTSLVLPGVDHLGLPSDPRFSDLGYAFLRGGDVPQVNPATVP